MKKLKNNQIVLVAIVAAVVIFVVSATYFSQPEVVDAIHTAGTQTHSELGLKQNVSAIDFYASGGMPPPNEKLIEIKQPGYSLIILHRTASQWTFEYRDPTTTVIGVTLPRQDCSTIVTDLLPGSAVIVFPKAGQEPAQWQSVAIWRRKAAPICPTNKKQETVPVLIAYRKEQDSIPILTAPLPALNEAAALLNL